MDAPVASVIVPCRNSAATVESTKTVARTAPDGQSSCTDGFAPGIVFQRSEADGLRHIIADASSDRAVPATPMTVAAARIAKISFFMSQV